MCSCSVFSSVILHSGKKPPLSNVSSLQQLIWSGGLYIQLWLWFVWQILLFTCLWLLLNVSVHSYVKYLLFHLHYHVWHASTEAVPKKILELMNVPGLTRENVASHLQVQCTSILIIQKSNTIMNSYVFLHLSFTTLYSILLYHFSIICYSLIRNGCSPFWCRNIACILEG